MELTVSRRQALALGAGGLGLVIGIDYASGASLSFSVADVSTTTMDGSIEDIYIYETDSYLDMEWSGFDSDPDPALRVDVRADPNADTINSHLIGTDATSYSHELGGGYILNSTYGGLSGTSGSVSGVDFSTIYSNTSFPVGIIANHPGLSESDFVPSSTGNTEKVVLQYLVEFDDSTYGIVDSATTTNTVTVDYIEPQITGTVTLDGNALEGAKVYVVNTNDNTVAGSDQSSTDGSYAVTGLTSGEEYHALAQYKDTDGNVYQDYSNPFIVI